MQKIKIQNARLSFPSVFKKAVFDGVETKFEATFLLSKDEQTGIKETIEKAAEAFLKEKFAGKAIPKGIKRTYLIDGDEKDYAGYADHWAIKATSTRRPTVVDRDRSTLYEEDDVLYAGCYVNGIISFWYSDHQKGGKQLLANLHGVQFVKDGKAFSAGDEDVSDEFDELED